MIDQPIEQLIEYFRQLPGVGKKTAQRYAYYIIENNKEKAENFAKAILEVKNKIRLCKECGNYSSTEVCPLCQRRDKKTICVVQEPKDIVSLEKVKTFDGVYHILFGAINPLENKGPNDIRIKELLARVNAYGTEEVIMATNPNVEGDATAMYIAKILKPLGVKVTRLAQGISMGSDIEFADEVTLSRAISDRKEI
ncbi:MAG: recombination protein RecR [Clostridiales bacterium]|nr:recombination protein RecR [Clostridiales bacterium]